MCGENLDDFICERCDMQTSFAGGWIMGADHVLLVQDELSVVSVELLGAAGYTNQNAYYRVVIRIIDVVREALYDLEQVSYEVVLDQHWYREDQHH